MLELLLIIAVIIIVIVAIKLGKQDNTVPTFQQLPKSGYQIMYEKKLAEVKRQAEERGDEGILNAIDNDAYSGKMPELKPDGSYSSIYNIIVKYDIAGANYRKNINDYVGDFFGYIQPEPTNEHDSNAIAIYHSDGHHVGYIPAADTDDVRELGLPFPIDVWGSIEKNYDYDKNRNNFGGTIYIEISKNNDKDKKEQRNAAL